MQFTCGKSRPSSVELNSHLILDVDPDLDFVASAIDKLLLPSCQYWNLNKQKNETNSNDFLSDSDIVQTSKWLFAWIDHSSRVANIRPHNSHDHVSGWFAGWFGIEPIFVCWLFGCWLCIFPCNRLFGVDSWCILCECIRFCLFSLFPDFFLISVKSIKQFMNEICHPAGRSIRMIVYINAPSAFKLLSLFPKGAIFVGVTCLNLFMWITNLSRRANALSQTYWWKLNGCY